MTLRSEYEVNVAKAWGQKLWPLAVVVAVAAGLIALLFLIPTPADAQTVGSACAKPTKKAAAKMYYGSGDLGPLGGRTLDGNMASADVALFGDSISARTCGELKSQLAALNKTLATDAQASREITKTAADIESYAELPKTVLVGIGTNNIFNPIVFGAQMDRILAHLKAKGVENVLWVDVQVCRTGTANSPAPAAQKIADQRNTMAINIQIHDRLPAAQIIGWAWTFISNPSRITLYTPDGVHPDEDGVLHWCALVMPKLKPLVLAA